MNRPAPRPGRASAVTTAAALAFALPFWFSLLAHPPARAGTVVQFRTPVGDIEAECYDSAKPVTTTNFLRYIADGAYNGMFFHRSVPDFVIQGGGYRVAHRGTANANVERIPSRAPITNEFKVGPFLSNVAGTLAMAKTSDPNSATSEFFFNLKDNTSLDATNNSGGFTVFARVIRGADTFLKLNSFQYHPVSTNFPDTVTNRIVDVRDPKNPHSPFGELPITRLGYTATGGRTVLLSDLVYCDVTLLGVRVSRTATGAAQVQWNPVANRTNVVEYTDVFPPQWQTLRAVPPSELPATVYDGNGVPADGAPLNLPSITVGDVPEAPPGRFYRVRATY
jgi:cyclophilin family peptidyl-prolyl cis-trans isomerase